MKSPEIALRAAILLSTSLLPLVWESCASQVYLGKDKDGKDRYAYVCRKGDLCSEYEGSYVQWGPQSGTQSSCARDYSHQRRTP